MDKKEQQKTFDLSILWHNVKRTFPRLFWLPIVLCLALGGWKYWSVLRGYVPVYEATAIYRVTSTRNGSMDITARGYYLDTNAAVNLASSYSYIMNSEAAKAMVRDLTGSSSLPAKVTCKAETTLLIFTSTGSNPDKLMQALEIVAEVFPEAAVAVRGKFQLEPFDVGEKPTTPTNKVNPLPDALKYGLLGLAVGLALICLVAYFRKTVHNSEDLRELLNVPCLGLLPAVRFKARTKQNRRILISNSHLDESYIEAVRGVRFQLRKELERQNAKVIMITSTSPGEGKSTVSANLSLSLAELGSRVVLVDCDLRKQTLKDLLGIKEATTGLVDLISGRVKDIDEALVKVEGSDLLVLSGDRIAEQPQNFLSAPQLQTIVKYLREHADYVIVDTPPSGLLSDAATLSEWVDGTIYVVRQDYMSRPAILDSVQRLGNVDIRFIGCIINRTVRRTSSSGYGYSVRKGSGYGYGYGYGYGSGYGYGYGKKGYGSRKTEEEESESYQK